jgi:hypothetical protein
MHQIPSKSQLQAHTPPGQASRKNPSMAAVTTGGHDVPCAGLACHPAGHQLWKEVHRLALNALELLSLLFWPLSAQQVLWHEIH